MSPCIFFIFFSLISLKTAIRHFWSPFLNPNTRRAYWIFWWYTHTCENLTISKSWPKIFVIAKIAVDLVVYTSSKVTTASLLSSVLMIIFSLNVSWLQFVEYMKFVWCVLMKDMPFFLFFFPLHKIQDSRYFIDFLIVTEMDSFTVLSLRSYFKHSTTLKPWKIQISIAFEYLIVLYVVPWTICD